MRAVSHAVALLLVASVVATATARSHDHDLPAAMSPAEKLLKEARDYSIKGDFDAAYQRLDAALGSDPHFWQAVYFRAELHFQQGNYDATAEDCAEVLRMNPSQVVAALLRAQAYTKLGRNEECLRELDRVIAGHYNKKEIAILVTAYEMRAWLRATSPDGSVRDGRLAVADAKQACKLSKDSDAQSLDTLAAAYAEAGDFDSTLDAEDRAIKAQMVSDEFNMATQNIFQKHLQSFHQKRPLRDG